MIRSDIAAATADILNDDGLAPSVRELVGHDPGQRIERGSRRKRDDDLDRRDG